MVLYVTVDACGVIEKWDDDVSLKKIKTEVNPYQGEFSCISPDGKHVLLRDACFYYLWNISTNKCITKFISGVNCDNLLTNNYIFVSSMVYPISGISIYSYDGTLVAQHDTLTFSRTFCVSNDEKLICYNITERNITITPILEKKKDFQTMDGDVETVAFSKDSTKIAICYSFYGTIWNVASKSRSYSFGAKEQFCKVISYGNQFITGSISGCVKFWCFLTGNLLKTISIHKPRNTMWGLDISCENYLFTSSCDGKSYLYDLGRNTKYELDVIGFRFLPYGKESIQKY